MESDESQPIPPAERGPQPGTVGVEQPAPGVVIVTLAGEHDLATRQGFSDALEQAGDAANILVDLSGCTFMDSTTIGVLVVAFQAQSQRGRRLELTIPPAARALQRTAEVAGLTTFLTIHESREAGLASIQSEL